MSGSASESDDLTAPLLLRNRNRLIAAPPVSDVSQAHPGGNDNVPPPGSLSGPTVQPGSSGTRSTQLEDTGAPGPTHGTSSTQLENTEALGGTNVVYADDNVNQRLKILEETQKSLMIELQTMKDSNDSLERSKESLERAKKRLVDANVVPAEGVDIDAYEMLVLAQVRAKEQMDEFQSKGVGAMQQLRELDSEQMTASQQLKKLDSAQMTASQRLQRLEAKSFRALSRRVTVDIPSRVMRVTVQGQASGTPHQELETEGFGLHRGRDLAADFEGIHNVVMAFLSLLTLLYVDKCSSTLIFCFRFVPLVGFWFALFAACRWPRWRRYGTWVGYAGIFILIILYLLPERWGGCFHPVPPS